jgi:RNA polymerase sigma-70 factor (ECF subfamily)
MRLQLWHSTRAYAGTAKASSWVYRVCLNTAMTWRRSTNRREQKFDRETDIEGLTIDGQSPAKHADDREILDQLYAAIQRLSDFDRALVLLSLDGISYREMADIIGITETHVGVALGRARKRLTGLMKGLTDELE